MHPAHSDEGWQSRHHDRVADLKAISDPEERAILARELGAACQRVYRWVAFDIDGALTKPASAEIDPVMANIIGDLLLRSVPVVLITGRGRGSARDAVDEVRKLAKIGEHYMRRLSCVTHNGVFWLQTPPQHSDQILSSETRLFEDDVDIAALTALARAALGERFSAGEVSVNEEPASLRVQFNGQDDIEEAVEILRRVGAEFDGPELFVSTGSYAGVASLDLSPSNKQFALRLIAQRQGISPDAILRIGDQGAQGGNDFDLLDSPAGFSVGEFSPAPTGCFPVLGDDLADPMRGAEATSELLTRALLFPPLSIAPRPHADCYAALRRFNQEALARAKGEGKTARSKLRLRINSLLTDSEEGLHASLEIADIFDPRSGGVKFRDWEIDLIAPDGAAQALFQFPRPDGPAPPRSPRSVYTDTAILARGPSYYYSETQSPEELNLTAYLESSRELLALSRELITEIGSRDFSLIDYKLLAAVQDNVRNVVLQLQYATFLAEREDPNRHSGLARGFYREAVLAHTVEQIASLTDNQLGWQATLKNYEDVLVVIEAILDKLATEPPSFDEKLFKWRECDHFVENLMAVEIGLRKLRADPSIQAAKTICCVGLAYGGIELPAIADAISVNQGFRVTVAISRISIYSESEVGEKVRAGGREYVELLRDLEQPFCFLNGEDHLEGTPTVIMDDNCTTGVTMQTARDALVMRGADVIGAVIVRFPGVNRQVQMAMDNHGFPDPEILFGFVRGLVAASPYARLIVPGEPGPKTVYLDEGGVFNKEEERIRRYMEKNGTPFQ